MSDPASKTEPRGPTPAEEIFYDALAHSPRHREAFADRACAGNDVLRAEVMDLLRHHEDASGFMTAAAAIPPDLSNRTHQVPEKAGDRIGHYRLLEPIGEGGFGIVWMAEQELPVRRMVALKIIKLGMDTREVVARFDQERQALALMDHPNIARVFDAGATQSGRPFFAMELVRGIRITDYCDEHHLPTADRLRLFMTVCQAVQHAHQKGVIHRDLKPSNILVTQHDGIPSPMVIDFGIAKAIQRQRLTDLTLFTRFEQMVGTPLYMAPEQAEPSGLNLDTRSDIYSLGVLLYELLTGRTPFDPEELLQHGLDEIRRILREEVPPKPSTYISTLALGRRSHVAESRRTDGASLTGMIRGDLDWIVMKALEKDRSRRYDTASSFARDIQRHLLREPVEARPPTAGYRLQRFAQRHRTALAATATVLGALIAGLSVSTWMFVNERRAREEAAAARMRAETETVKSQQAARFLRDMLKGVGPSVAQGRDTALLGEILDRTTGRLDRELADHPEVRCGLQGTLGEVYRQLGDYDKATAILRRSLETAREIWGGSDNPNLASALGSLALVLLEDGKPDEAEPLQREALAMVKALHGGEHPSIAHAADKLAGILAKQGHLKAAASLHRDSLAMKRRLLGPDHEEVASSLNNLAVVLKAEGNFPEAEKFAQEAVSLARKRFGKTHPNVAASLNNLGAVLKDQRKFDDAVSIHREALALWRELHGNQHRFVATSLNNLAGVFEDMGALDKAEPLYRESLELRRTLLGPDHPEVASSLNNLGVLFEHRRDFREAEALHRQALAIQRKTSANRPNAGTALTVYNLASVVAQQGRLPEAESLYQEALDVRRAKLGEAHPQVAESFAALRQVLLDQGKLTQCESLLQEELKAVRGLTRPNAARLETILAALGQCLYRQEKFSASEPLYRELIESRQKRLGNGDDNVVGPKARLGRLLSDWAWSERNSGLAPKPQSSSGEARALEAERLLRECLQTVRSKPDADTPGHDLATVEFSSRLGGALVSRAATDPALSSDVRLSLLTEAKSLLLESNEALQARHDAESENKRDSLIRLVRLYQAWPEPDQAAAWEKTLADFDAARSTTSRPAAP